MAKENKKSTNQNSNKILIPQKYQNVLAGFLICLMLIIFFREAIFTGSFVNAGDNINFGAGSFRNYIADAEEFPLWQPYIFGGMPGMAARMETPVRYWDLTVASVEYVSLFFKKMFDSQTARNLVWYMIMGIGMYLLILQHKDDKLIAFFVATAFIYCAGIVIWEMIGHTSKSDTFAVVPYIFVLMERIKKRASLLNLALLIIVMHIMLAGGHYQLIFYVACAVIIYILIDLITQIVKKGNWIAITKLIGCFFIATAFAFLMSADRELAVLEYVPHSTRGSAPITERISTQNDDGTVTAARKNEVAKKTEADYEYATMWSFSPGEIIDFFVPSYHGFGKVKYTGPLTGNREQIISTYWGQKPFEDATPYMGATVMFLALLGMIRFFKTNTFVQALTVTTFFGLFLSFGYTFPILYDFFFYYVPMFSSFRAPSMALILLHLTMPILAAFGLKAICEMNQKVGSIKQLSSEEKKPLFIFFGAIGLFTVAGLIFAAIFESSYIQQVTNHFISKGYNEQVASLLAPFVWEMVISDWTIIGFLCLSLAGLTYAFINKKMPKSAFLIAVILIAVIDLWRIAYRPMEVVDKQIERQPFPRTDIVNFILNEQKETGERFRITDMSMSVTNSHAYFFIENTNGYSPAKLRNFQDMMDIMCGGSTNFVTHPFMWNLMNSKYIITSQRLGGGIEPFFQSQQTGAFVYYNPSYCKRAFFVDSVAVSDDWTILNNMNQSNYNPKTLAYIEKPLAKEIVPSGQHNAETRELIKMIQQNDPSFTVDEDTNLDEDIFAPTVTVVDFKNEYIKIETVSQGQHLLVVSEMYYPAGWKAFVNGEETEIYKTNFAFRSVVVPAGNNTVEFKFVSERFLLGKNLSLASNILVIFALGLGIFFERKRTGKILEREL